MTALSIQPPFPIMTDIDGQPLEDGYIFIGVANLQPIGNPIAVYWDAGLTIPAPLPIRTQGGYPVNSGTPARLYVGSDYSIQVQDKNGSVAYTALSATERYNETVITNVSSTNVSFLQAGSGAVVRTAQSKMRDTVNVNDFGADPTGVADSSPAFAAAIAAVDVGGTIFLSGVYRTTKEILITKTLSIVGQDSRTGNVPSPSSSKSAIIADSTTDAAAIFVKGCLATLRNFVLSNGDTNPSVRVDGVRVQEVNSSVKIYDLVVQLFQTGIRCTQAYYNIIENTSVEYCDTCVRFNNCYNAQLINPKLRSNNTALYGGVVTRGMIVENGSQVNVFGGAIESFNEDGILLFGNDNSVALFGAYFESESVNNDSACVRVDTRGRVVAIACFVYLTHSRRFITVLGNALGLNVYSRNNRIVWPTTTKTVEAYVPKIVDSTASWDIAGDNWASPIGANVIYLTYEPIGGDGIFNVEYPIGHPLQLKPLHNNVEVQAAWTSAPTLPVSSQTSTVLPTFVPFANQGFAGDDPLGLGATPWGYFPYMTIYQKGQWEKVGTRLPNQADSTAINVAGIVSDFNALLLKMRNNGIMI